MYLDCDAMLVLGLKQVLGHSTPQHLVRHSRVLGWLWYLPASETIFIVSKRPLCILSTGRQTDNFISVPIFVSSIIWS